jgi:hypothetical protein
LGFILNLEELDTSSSDICATIYRVEVLETVLIEKDVVYLLLDLGRRQEVQVAENVIVESKKL